ncbi:HEAT repeat domain-containing protein [Natrinema versiforme]|nr:HEAT repeat domain-containing protein [Natrinema versiforme]
MTGDGGEAVEPRGRGATGVDLPAILTRLEAEEPTTQRTAVQRIRTAIDDRGRTAAYAPTVPKLRALLERPEIDFHDEVAACLADLAAEVPTDVAPSTGAILGVAVERADQPATAELLRCIAAVAAERPDVVADHAAEIADVLEERCGYDRQGILALEHVSREEPTAIEPAVPVLTDALASAPDEYGLPALRALGRLARSGATPPSLEFVARAAALVDRDETALRHAAIDCLGDAARCDPAAVESVCDELGAALARDDPDTRAVAADAIARLAAESEPAIEPVRGRLLESLADDHPRVRANACLALGYGRVDAAESRLEELASEDPAPTVRDRAAWAVAQVS